MNNAGLKVALELLRKEDRFSAEVRESLLGRGFVEPDVEEIVSFLLERKLLNDTRTTQSLIEKRSGKRSVGVERLRAELEKRGAPENDLEHLLEGQDESARALTALQSKYKTEVDRAKAGRFLYSRGFSEEAIEAALDQFCGFPE